MAATRALVAATISLAVERARPYYGCDHQPKFGGKADPDPWPPILTVGQTFPCRIRLPSVLARDEVPQLVELHLGHRQVPQSVSVDRFGLVSRTPELCQHGRFRHAEHKADACQINTDQAHLESHHNLCFRCAEIKKDCVACLSKVCRTHVAVKDASLATVGEIRGHSTHVALLHSSIMRALGIGARLAPIFGVPQRSILR